jgi:hypothetical protein
MANSCSARVLDVTLVYYYTFILYHKVLTYASGVMTSGAKDIE